MFKDDVKNGLGIELSTDQLKKFDIYYNFLIEYNEITNLTRITDEEEVYYKHFYDSLTIVKSLDINKIMTLCDMGAGAGFPSIPLKIMFPHLHVTIIDSLGKRITFLKLLIEKLNLENVFLVYDRIENYARINHDSFDLVTARALGKLPLILELGLPMNKVNGYFVAYKSKSYEEELNEASNALRLLGGKLIKVISFEIPNAYGDRVHILIQKHKKSPLIYPRSFSAIKKKSL
ncbi:16S rRNA (guanine(527)-N(7))-methyltransferase RsmG [Tenericutes bacterium MO-XQ]|nr:16S rRNA (guanine(527)-N(7))-methyltransferase RsmG [Tenericutes bacterium MO-XQ]